MSGVDLTDPDLKVAANMQHIARNLYYLQQYPERIPLADPFIHYYQDQSRLFGPQI